MEFVLSQKPSKTTSWVWTPNKKFQVVSEQPHIKSGKRFVQMSRTLPKQVVGNNPRVLSSIGISMTIGNNLSEFVRRHCKPNTESVPYYFHDGYNIRVFTVIMTAAHTPKFKQNCLTLKHLCDKQRAPGKVFPKFTSYYFKQYLFMYRSCNRWDRNSRMQSF